MSLPRHILSRFIMNQQKTLLVRTQENVRREFSEATGKNLSYNPTNAAFNPQDEIDAVKDFLNKKGDDIKNTFYG